MSAQINVREYSDFLQFAISGSESLQSALEYWRRVGEDCGRKGFLKALIVSDMQGRLSAGAMSSLAGRIGQYLRGLKIALVHKQSDDYGRQLAEIISRQGGCTVCAFRSMNQAENWLG